MKSRFVIYIPTDTHEATAVSFAKVAGVPLFLRNILSLASLGETVFTIIAPAGHRRNVLKSWQKIIKGRPLHLNLILTGPKNRLSDLNIMELTECSEDTVYLLDANRIFTNPKDILRQTKLPPNSCHPQHGQTGQGNNSEGITVKKFVDAPVAEHMLAEHIRKNTATWVAREINKRISLPISLFLARMRISPNTITVINMLIGLCAGIGAAGKTYIGVLLGAILFQTASIVDGCDGEVAKLTFRTSKFGQYIDSLSDNTALAGFLIGMMIHQHRITDSHMAFIWGGALLLGVFFILAIMIDFLKKNTDSASFVTFDKEYLQKLSPEAVPRWLLNSIKYVKILFKKDCFSFMFLVFAILGVLHWWFYIITVGVWVAVTVLVYLRRFKGPRLT